MVGNLAQNLLQHGTGAINIDACRVPVSDSAYARNWRDMDFGMGCGSASELGRWPANIQHDGSEEVVSCFPAEAGAFAPVRGTEPSTPTVNVYGEFKRGGGAFHADHGSAARFFYTAKADAEARIYECTICQRKINAGDRARHKHGQKNNAHIKSHPTVKPIDLIRYYLRLIVPPGGTVIDPFAGTGTTGEAAMLEGFDCLMIERDEGSVADIQHRIGRWAGADAPLFVQISETE
jgi:hypothetical protein